MRKARRWLAVLFFMMLLLAVAGAAAQTLQEEPWLWLEAGEGRQIVVQDTQYGDTLFLPSYMNMSALPLAAESDSLWLTAGETTVEVDLTQPVDLTVLFPDGPDEEGVYQLMVSAVQGETGRALRIRQSAYQAALFVTSGDPENRGRAYVDSLVDPKSDPITDASLLMIDAEGEAVYDDELRELRGRGNTTWEWGVKKAYQIKLEKKTDLLQSRNPANKERTWILLAESFDCSLVHNTVCLSLGHALELEGTPEFRPVDLYYDGEYRGYYLLTEKVNVKPGRLPIRELDGEIEEIYPSIADSERYPVADDVTDIGKIRYVSGLDVSFGQSGAYLVELDLYGGWDSESQFATKSEIEYEIRSPEYASREDVVYVQRLMNELEETALAGGVHPVSGKRLEECIDIDSLARFLLVNQFAKTCDFGYTSTNFYLPEGSTQFKAGPLWDFDIAFAMRDTRPYEGGVEGYVPQERWIWAVMDVPVVQEAMQRIYFEEMEPLISDVLLAQGDAEQKGLRSLESYLMLTESSRRMNYDLWELGGEYRNINKETLYPTFEENWEYFVNYVKGRHEWLNWDMALWSGNEIEHAELALSYVNADVANSAIIQPGSVYQNYTVSAVTWSSVPDEETPWRAIYTAEVELTAEQGSRFTADATAGVNGTEAQVVAVSDTSMTVRFAFSGPVYVPAVYEDVDYGMLFHYDYYVDQYPELLDEYGDDPEAILENYVYYDLPVGVAAIETFDFDLYYEAYMPVLEAYFFSDTYESTMYYLDNDQPELMRGMGELIAPAEDEFRPIEK
ncbi:MAG: hypothetical protein E7319_08575 [Clostridiales bacterium]|nr:hypothetical protein [Clostridiales bacterium]